MSLRKRRSRFLTLLLPAGGFFLVTLGLPLLILTRVSLLEPGPGAPLSGALTWQSYRALWDGYFVELFIRTVRIAFLTTAGCVVLAYPLAWSLARSTGLWRRIQFFLIVSPLFLSVVVRAYGWLLLVGRQGLLNTVAEGVGVGRPIALLNTELGVLLAMIEALVPFMVLSLAPMLAQIDSELIDAARGLGASRREVFLHVILPISFPGVAAGASLVFLVSMGAYATPAMVGGARIRVLVSEIYTQVTSVFNWPLAAALSLSLLAFCLLVSHGISRLSNRVTRWSAVGTGADV